MGVCLENEEPCWLFRRAGFSKIDDLCEIVNYLLASLVWVSLPKLRRGLLAWILHPRSDFQKCMHIPKPRRQAVACFWLEYVKEYVMGCVM